MYTFATRQVSKAQIDVDAQTVKAPWKVTPAINILEDRPVKMLASQPLVL